VIIESLDHLSDLLEQRFGWTDSSDELVLKKVTAPEVPVAIESSLGFELPSNYAELVSSYRFAGLHWGISFGTVGPSEPKDYADWVLSVSAGLDPGWLAVGQGDPFWVLMDPDGLLSARAPGDSDVIPLNIDFRQLVIGLANLMLTSDRDGLRKRMVEEWGSPEDFWRSV